MALLVLGENDDSKGQDELSDTAGRARVRLIYAVLPDSLSGSVSGVGSNMVSVFAGVLGVQILAR